MKKLLTLIVLASYTAPAITLMGMDLGSDSVLGKRSTKDARLSAELDTSKKAKTESDELIKLQTRVRLFKAIEDKDLAAVQVALAQNPDIESPYIDENGENRGNALQFMFNENFNPTATNAVILKELLMHGANPNVQCLHGRTPLHEVFTDPNCVELLIKHGADIDVQDKEGVTPLAHACDFLRTECSRASTKGTLKNMVLSSIALLMKNGANPDLVSNTTAHSTITILNRPCPPCALTRKPSCQSCAINHTCKFCALNQKALTIILDHKKARSQAIIGTLTGLLGTSEDVPKLVARYLQGASEAPQETTCMETDTPSEGSGSAAAVHPSPLSSSTSASMSLDQG